jgi:hypothetical protein
LWKQIDSDGGVSYSTHFTRYYQCDLIEEDYISAHAVLMREIRNVYNNLVGKSEGENHLGDLAVDGRITLKRNLEGIRC